MKLCRALYGHGCTCDCTQVISKPAAVCLGSCEHAGPCPPWICFVLDRKSLDDLKQAARWRHTWLWRYRAVLSCFLPVCSSPSELWWELDVHVPQAVPQKPCENLCVQAPGWGLCVLICGTGHLGRERKQLQSRTDEWLWFVGLCFLFHFKTGVWCFSSGE